MKHEANNFGGATRAVVAFGGNAISRSDQRGTYQEQLDNVRAMSSALAQLVINGVEVVITHGNGPQVGKIALQQDLCSETIPPMPFDAAGAMSGGLIGYMLQQTLTNTLASMNASRPCVTVVTQVVVDEDDPAFRRPTKPVGAFYDEAAARALERDRAWTMVEDAGRGFRRVVPSPMPVDIVEWPAIKTLIDGGALVIAAGGGGVPVVRDPNSDASLRGVEAVIDKDRASARLGELVAADTLVLLTDVARVAVGYGTAEQRWLDRVSVREMRGYLDAGEFPAGSMGPKVESAIRFLEAGGERCIITSAANMVDAVVSGGGTEVLSDVKIARSAPEEVHG